MGDGRSSTGKFGKLGSRKRFTSEQRRFILRCIAEYAKYPETLCRLRAEFHTTITKQVFYHYKNHKQYKTERDELRQALQTRIDEISVSSKYIRLTLLDHEVDVLLKRKKYSVPLLQSLLRQAREEVEGMGGKQELSGTLKVELVEKKEYPS